MNPSAFAILTLALLCSRLLGFCAERWNLATSLKEPGFEQVTLRRTDENHLFLFAKIDGKRRSCLVDTGWSWTTVSTNTASGMAGTNSIGRLNLGNVVRMNVPVATQDLRVNGQPAPYDMVLGCDFLITNNAVIDCANRRLYLRERTLTTEQSSVLTDQMRRAGYIETELERRNPPAVTSQVKLNDHTVEMLVDTGAMWSCVDERIALSLELRSTLTSNQISGPAARSRKMFSVVDANRLEIGAYSTSRASLAVLNLADWGLGPDGKLFSDVGGILGGGELANANAVIDFGSMKLWLRTGR